MFFGAAMPSVVTIEGRLSQALHLLARKRDVSVIGFDDLVTKKGDAITKTASRGSFIPNAAVGQAFFSNSASITFSSPPAS